MEWRELQRQRLLGPFTLRFFQRRPGFGNQRLRQFIFTRLFQYSIFRIICYGLRQLEQGVIPNQSQHALYRLVIIQIAQGIAGILDIAHGHQLQLTNRLIPVTDVILKIEVLHVGIYLLELSLTHIIRRAQYPVIPHDIFD